MDTIDINPDLLELIVKRTEAGDLNWRGFGKPKPTKFNAKVGDDYAVEVSVNVFTEYFDGKEGPIEVRLLTSEGIGIGEAEFRPGGEHYADARRVFTTVRDRAKAPEGMVDEIRGVLRQRSGAGALASSG